MLVALKDELFDQGRGERTGHLGIGIPSENLDDSCPFLRKDAVVRGENVAHLILRVVPPVDFARKESGVVLEMVRLNHAQQNISASERLNDRIDVLRCPGSFLGHIFNLEHLFFGGSDIDQSLGFINSRFPSKQTNQRDRSKDHDDGNDPDPLKKQENDAPEINSLLAVDFEHPRYRPFFARFQFGRNRDSLSRWKRFEWIGSRITFRRHEKLKNRFTDRNDVPGTDHKGRTAAATCHFLGIEL